MKKHWFRDRLIPKKQRSGMWSDLSDSIETLIANHVDDKILRLKNRVSIFDMRQEDLKILLAEMGKFFAIGDVTDSNAALILMQREDEIHLKNTIYPLVNTMHREFSGMKVEWTPRYAPADLDKYPYPTVLKSKAEILNDSDDDISNWFLTSRGVIEVDHNDIIRGFSKYKDPMAHFESEIRKVIYPLVPLRIVCEGIKYVFTCQFDLQFRDDTTHLALMDCQECDSLPLDFNAASKVVKYSVTFNRQVKDSTNDLLRFDL